MSGHLQIHVQKQGSIDETSWSDRTLTIDVPTETVTISRHDHPDDLYHHSMRLLGIQKWADMKATSSGHGHDSAEAKMTLHLIGVKVPAMKFNSEDAKSHASSGAPDQHPSPINHHPGGVASDVDDSWMVRCVAAEAYEAAVKMLSAIVHARETREAGHHTEPETAPNGPFIPGPVAGESTQRIGGSAVL